MAETKQTQEEGTPTDVKRGWLAGRVENPRLRNLLETIQALALAVLIALFIRHFFVEPFKIPSGSMIPTLRIGDHIFVNKFIYGVTIPFTRIRFFHYNKPQRGDVIVFINQEDNNRDYIKRVIGLPGDLIEQYGRNILVNGKKIELLSDGYYYYMGLDNFNNAIRVKALKYYEQIKDKEHEVLYRNGPYAEYQECQYRKQLEKCRYLNSRVPAGKYLVLGDNRDRSKDSRNFGYVPMKNIKGRAIVVWFSYNRFGKGILDYIRWNRFGELIK